MKKENYNVEEFLSYKKEERGLIANEIICINALCQTAINFGYGKDIVLGPGRTQGKACIFKTVDEEWIVWRTNERGNFSYPEQFNDIKDACISVINRVSNEDNIDKSFECFDYYSKKEYTEEELIKMAKEMNYTYIPTLELNLYLSR